MICFNSVVYHRPDNCKEKFGFHKIDTSGCRNVLTYKSKKLGIKDYSLEKFNKEWDHRKSSLVKGEQQRERLPGKYS